MPNHELLPFSALSAPTSTTHQAGEVLFYEGDPADALIVLDAGRAVMHKNSEPCGEIGPGALLDPVATLGGLRHSVKITLLEDSVCQHWSLENVWKNDVFAAAARRYLAAEVQRMQTRLDEVDAPVHYANPRGELVPGPFLFDDVTLIFAFCDAEPGTMQALLPPGLRLLHRPIRRRDSILLALARFPKSYPESDPAARFGYTETTCFIPVRLGRGLGLYVPYIYPSAWEPILLGREIYGFPKRPGLTTIDAHRAALAVDGKEQFAVEWSGMEASDETRLVRALVDWLGLGGRGAALLFRAGDVLRSAMRLPPFRSIGVYNHKQILAPEATADKPVYTVDCLTHAIFGVLRWYQIVQMREVKLTVSSGPLANANLVLREAYRTQLDMRLSAGRTVKDYKNYQDTSD